MPYKLMYDNTSDSENIILIKQRIIEQYYILDYYYFTNYLLLSWHDCDFLQLLQE